MTASGCRLENHVEIETQIFTAFNLSFTLTSVAGSFPSFIYDFFIHICFGFDETKLTKGQLYGELRPVLKYKFKERG